MMMTRMLPPLLVLALLAGCAAHPSAAISRAPVESWGADSSSTARVRLYCARVSGWRAAAAVHSWIAIRRDGEAAWYCIEVMGFGRQLREAGTYIRIREREPNRRYRGGKAQLLMEIEGETAERAITRILAAVEEYPYAREYRMYPGPNSNTFISYLLRSVPEMKMELPPTAIGKDWLPSGMLAITESGTGGQFSLFGVLGLQAGAAEGIEVNVLGLSLGLDVLSPALKLPFFGRVGFRDRPVFGE